MNEREGFRPASAAGEGGATSEQDVGAHSPTSRPRSFERATLLFERSSGLPYQFMVDLWEDGRVTLAYREHTGDVWSPPVEGRREDWDEQWLDQLRELGKIASGRGSVVALHGASTHSKDGRSQPQVTGWTEPSTSVPNEPIAAVPYDVENDSTEPESSPPDAESEWRRYLVRKAQTAERWTCLVCGHQQSRWFGEAPAACASCGAEQKDREL